MPAAAFNANAYVPTIIKARQLGDTLDDESEPYKSRYAAADLLKQLEEEVQPSSGSGEAEEFVAWCKLEHGLQLLETDLLAEGQKLLEEGLSYAWQGTVECMAMQLQAHNALASLWCERSENETALNHLHAAAQLHSKIVRLADQQQQQQEEDQQEHVVTSCTDSKPKAVPDLEQQQQHAQDPEQQQPQDNQSVRPPAAAAASQASTLPLADAAEAQSSSCRSWQAALHIADSVDRDHTTTLFYMAQVHGLMGDKMQSAAYCAATLNRQLKQDACDLNEWVQNCLQLSGCYLDCNTFALSQHCCAAVEALLLLQQQRQYQGQDTHQDTAHSCDNTPDTPNSLQGRDTGEQQQQQQLPSTGKDQTEGKDQAGKSAQQQKPSAGKAQPEVAGAELDAEGGCGPSAPLVAALALLDHDVAANVCLAQAKRHLYCLVASHEAIVEGKQVDFGYSSAAEVPAALCFDALQGLAALTSLPWGPAALVDSYGEALQLFKAALHWFKRALEYYKLDGWVTEHTNILFEMSNLYRCLAGFEADPHKRCVMHRSRAKLLQPLEGQLSPTHYPGLSRSISLELGNIFREIADIKAAAGREPDKVAAAMQSAAQHYQLFLDSFRNQAGQLPHKVEPEMQQHYLGGLFSMARMLQGLPGTGTLGTTATGSRPAADLDEGRQEEVCLEKAVSLLGALVKYVQGNQVAEWQEQAAMAKELAGLLEEKLMLVRHAQLK